MENDLPPSSEPPTTTPSNLNLPAVSTPFSMTPSKHFPRTSPQQEAQTPTHFFMPTNEREDYARLPTVPETASLPPQFTLPVPMEEPGVQSEYLDSLNATLKRFWENENRKIERLNPYSDEMFQYQMPLARIKKIMRFDPSVVMIGADAPILLSKACELILREMAVRAWYHTNQARRRTIKQSDLVAALALPKASEFDFLVDFIPREQQLMSAVAVPPTLPVQRPQMEEVEELSDKEKSRRALIKLVQQAVPEIRNMEPEKGLHLPDLADSSFPNTKWDELERLSKNELGDFPKDLMPLMLALLRSAFEHTSSESSKRMKF